MAGRPTLLLRIGAASLPLLVLAGCGKDENSPSMGAVPPKPNLDAAANAPGGAPRGAQPGADAQAMGRGGSKR